MKGIDEFINFDVEDYMKCRYHKIDPILREALDNRRVYPITTSNVCFVGMWDIWVPLNAKASKVVVLKGEYGYVKFNICK